MLVSCDCSANFKLVCCRVFNGFMPNVYYQSEMIEQKGNNYTICNMFLQSCLPLTLTNYIFDVSMPLLIV